MIHSRRTFNHFYKQKIYPQMNRVRENTLSIIVSDNAKVRIRKAYKGFRTHCKQNYMRNPRAPMDRHKVAACYLYAILAASPLIITSDLENIDGEKDRWKTNFANERLALSVGCSVLAGFICKNIDNMFAEKTLKNHLEAYQQLKEELETDGIHFPDEVGHGDYLDNLISCLRFTKVEENYNIMLMAEIFFELERNTFAHAEGEWNANQQEGDVIARGDLHRNFLRAIADKEG